LVDGKTDRLLKVMEMIEACGLQADDLFKFPHQFSGGQRQRVCIARALVAGPDMVVCDEAVSALDVSVQAQIINLLMDLREARDLTYTFISHDLEVVRFIADRVAVMYLGKVVEMARREDIFTNPKHPYTVMLLESAPVFGSKAKDEDLSDAPELMPDELLHGCRFRNRCPQAKTECANIDPVFKQISKSHVSTCLYS
jgi:oligopeptide/dipeptide ABC transporter ATP-binding protein